MKILHEHLSAQANDKDALIKMLSKYVHAALHSSNSPVIKLFRLNIEWSVEKVCFSATHCNVNLNLEL